MALEGPKVVYALEEGEPALLRALRLARDVESLLGDAEAAPASSGAPEASAHSARIARALAAGLVDELQGLLRGARTGGVA